MKTTRKDINQMITQRIIERIQTTGVLPWKKPWSSSSDVPRNLITRKPYRGINAFLLYAMGYEHPCWLTMRQVNELGGRVRKGEHACPVVFWKFFDEEEVPGETPNKRYALLRYYSVFNVSQCEGLPEHRIPQVAEQRAFLPLEEAERLVREMPDPPEIRCDSRRASYNARLDLVRMPPRECFAEASGFYEAIFHELTHASGHAKRLNRKEVACLGKRDPDDYSQEELVAEMGAAFLCGHCGILRQTEENAAAYLKHWLEKLNADPQLLVRAGSQAQKAYDYITNALPQTEALAAPQPLLAGAALF